MDKNDIIKQQAAIIEALQKEINELNKTFKDTDTKLKETQAFVENQKFEIEYLKAEVALLQNKKSGKSSDKITKDNYNLFNMDVINEVEINQETPEEEPIEIEEICYDDRYVRFMKKIIDRDTISSLELLNKMDFINYAIKNNRVLAIVTKKQEVEDFNDVKIIDCDGTYLKYQIYTRWAELYKRIHKTKISDIVMMQVDSKYTRLIEKIREE